MATVTEIRIPPLRDGDRLTVAEFERRRVLGVLQQGLASAEHRDFVAKLRAAAQ